MAQRPAVALVYQYTYWDQEQRTHRLSSAYATYDAIKHGLGIPLIACSKFVPEDEIVGGVWQEKRRAS